MSKTTKSFKEFAEALGDYGVNAEEFIKLIDASAKKSAIKVVKDVKSYPPFTNRTGLLTSSQCFKQVEPLQLIFENQAKSKKGTYYGKLLHDGTKYIPAMQWFKKSWEKEVPNFIKETLKEIHKEYKV